MGTVIDFPVKQRLSRDVRHSDQEEVGTVIILPVVRVERGPDNPSNDLETSARTGRKRRRRARS